MVDHKNVEGVIRYYLQFLPPKYVNSILDIGCGITAPYRGILKNRCIRYANIDMRGSSNVEYTFDITEGTPFSDKEFEWGWCTETIEHIPQKIQKKFIKEACRVCKNIIFTFPSPNHPSFSDDPGHAEVTFRFDKLANKFDVYKKTTKTGRNIVILTDKKEKVDITKRGIKYKDKKFIGPLDRWLDK